MKNQKEKNKRANDDRRKQQKRSSDEDRQDVDEKRVELISGKEDEEEIQTAKQR